MLCIPRKTPVISAGTSIAGGSAYSLQAGLTDHSISRQESRMSVDLSSYLLKSSGKEIGDDGEYRNLAERR